MEKMGMQIDDKIVESLVADLKQMEKDEKEEKAREESGNEVAEGENVEIEEVVVDGNVAEREQSAEDGTEEVQGNNKEHVMNEVDRPVDACSLQSLLQQNELLQANMVERILECEEQENLDGSDDLLHDDDIEVLEVQAMPDTPIDQMVHLELQEEQQEQVSQSEEPPHEENHLTQLVNEAQPEKDVQQRKENIAENPSPQNTIAAASNGENYDDEPDETLAERLWGLAEMFPKPVRNMTGSLAKFTVSSVKNVFKFSCNASWFFFTTSAILFAPVIFETERAQLAEAQKSQQKQVLLGPGTAMAASGPSPALPAIR